MPTHIGIGYSQFIDTQTAATEAMVQAQKNLGNHQASLIIIFSTIHHEPNILIQTAYSSFNTPKIIGCSSAGIILSEKIITHGIGVLAIASDDIQFGTGAVTGISPNNLRMAGSELGRSLISDYGHSGRSVCLFFLDGMIADSSLLLKGIQEILGNVFPIIGAGSCDDFRNVKTFQFCDGQAVDMAACGVILGGQISVGISGRHGWRPLGKPRVITSAEGNIIKTIDGKKASSLYEEYFDKEYQEIRTNQWGQLSILYPLGLFLEGNNQYLLRNAVDILDDGSIVCQGDAPEGLEVHIMIGNKDSCKQAAFEAASEAYNNLLGKKAKLVIVIESMARLKLLGRDASSEVMKIKQVFGQDVKIFGMYANSEICPFESMERIKKPYLQNESIVVLAIS